MNESADPPVTDSTLTTSTTGLRLHYQDWGGAGPPILLLHGLASSSHIWDLVAPRLRHRGRVIALDARGHAASDKPDMDYDTATIVADVAGAVQALGLTTPLVVGHSWGASVALAFAAQDPACPGVVLVDGGVVDMQADAHATWEEIARRLAPPDLSNRRLSDLVGGMGRALPHLDEEFRTRFFRSLMEEQPDGTIRPRLTRARHMQILRSMWDTRPTALLAAVTCPILVVLAENAESPRDPAYARARSAGRVLFTAHPRTTIHTLADTYHDIPLHRPAVLADLILEWMARET